MIAMHDPIDRKILALSKWIDEGSPDGRSEGQLWHRVAKVSEESGEVIEALIGLTGRNPRKGVCSTEEDLLKELLDTAVSALGAIAHLYGNTPLFSVMNQLEAALDVLLERVGIEVPS